MRTAVRVALPIVVVLAVLVAAIIAVFQGITEPDHVVLGISSRHADIAACWLALLGLPAGCIVDAARLDQTRWITARRGKFAWIATVAYVPCVGPLLYVSLARPWVVSQPRVRH